MNERGLYGAGFTLPSGKGACAQGLRQCVPARLQRRPVAGFDVAEAAYLLRKRSEGHCIRQGCSAQPGQCRIQRSKVMRQNRAFVAALGAATKRVQGAAA